MASLHSEAENNFLTGLTGEKVWLGGHDIAAEGDWEWSDGSTWTFKDWSSGQPNNQGGEDCLMINYSGKQWYDRSCTKKVRFVCKISK